MRIVNKLPDERVNHGDLAPPKQFVLLASALVFLVVVIYFVSELLISSCARFIPQSWEHRIFSKLPAIFEQHRVDTLTPTAQSLVDRALALTPEISLPISAVVVADPYPNAFALPGGVVVLTDSLVHKANSENEITMIIGHELGHFVLRHHLRRLGRSLFILAFSLAFGQEESASELFSVSSGLLALGYSRDEERAADEFGLNILYRVYGNAEGATDFFRAMDSLESTAPGTKYLSTHPSNEERIRALENLIAQRDYPHGSLVPKPDTFNLTPS